MALEVAITSQLGESVQVELPFRNVIPAVKHHIR